MFGVLHTSCYKGYPRFQNIESFKFLIYGGKTRLTKAQHDFEWKYMTRLIFSHDLVKSLTNTLLVLNFMFFLIIKVKFPQN